jgi:hypothetical protein
MVRGTGAIGPIDAVEALPSGALDPGGDRGNTDAEASCDGTQCLPSSDGGYHVSAALLLTLCLPIELPHERSV